MEILKDIFIEDTSLWIKKEKTLVIGDVHLGYEEAMNEKGILIPRKLFSEIKIKINNLIKKLKPKKIIFLGDIKHEFGKISKQEWDDFYELIKLISKKIKIVVIRGNHDTLIEPIINNLNKNNKNKILIKDLEFSKDKQICFIHGNKIPLSRSFYSKSIKIIVIGHEHPAITLIEGNKKEKYKCILFGEWNKKKLIVLPSFFSVIGTDVLKGNYLSPFLKGNKKINNFNVYIIQNKIYNFGKIKEIQRLFK